MEMLLTSNVSISSGNIKCPIAKSIFAHCHYVANADIESLKSLHTFLKKMFVPHASEI